MAVSAAIVLAAAIYWTVQIFDVIETLKWRTAESGESRPSAC